MSTCRDRLVLKRALASVTCKDSDLDSAVTTINAKSSRLHYTLRGESKGPPLSTNRADLLLLREKSSRIADLLLPRENSSRANEGK
eukprot:3513590-Rhodomonas_salina.1